MSILAHFGIQLFCWFYFGSILVPFCMLVSFRYLAAFGVGIHTHHRAKFEFAHAVAPRAGSHTPFRRKCVFDCVVVFSVFVAFVFVLMFVWWLFVWCFCFRYFIVDLFLTPLEKNKDTQDQQLEKRQKTPIHVQRANSKQQHKAKRNKTGKQLTNNIQQK